jgi:hypothetical protein
MPNPPLKKNSSPTVGKRFNSSLAWYLSSLGVVFIIAGALTYIAGTMYLTSEKLVSSSNKKIVETAGIEITVELKRKDMDIAKQIVARKSALFEMPPMVRDIFRFDSYMGENRELDIISPTSAVNLSL